MLPASEAANIASANVFFLTIPRIIIQNENIDERYMEWSWTEIHPACGASDLSVNADGYKF